VGRASIRNNNALPKSQEAEGATQKDDDDIIWQKLRLELSLVEIRLHKKINIELSVIG
jgi:hypothetical protein